MAKIPIKVLTEIKDAHYKLVELGTDSQWYLTGDGMVSLDDIEWHKCCHGAIPYLVSWINKE